MRVTLQRVKSASVSVAGTTVGQIKQGLVLFVGIAPEDTTQELTKMANKIAKLRIFEDDQQKMNLNLQQVGGEILSISQFTLYADTRKGNRPSFTAAAKPDQAEAGYLAFNALLADLLQQPIPTGEFGADMTVTVVNDGPVTINLEVAHD
ncbi:D-aminoacyl-tRNA deacylase [Lapidilactobacillus luobeiensis]|uniref:D-aminoacyl-tRNA deacylase n=1 Tax=Lapidilactobacillus luobeiensis TaxID=2950371 RepID=UPI0021C4373F|nr:D-aminoacyl-tRNA deacylase [Lapidilactobacillus luobeiensis]